MTLFSPLSLWNNRYIQSLTFNFHLLCEWGGTCCESGSRRPRDLIEQCGEWTWNRGNSHRKRSGEGFRRKFSLQRGVPRVNVLGFCKVLVLWSSWTPAVNAVSLQTGRVKDPASEQGRGWLGEFRIFILGDKKVIEQQSGAIQEWSEKIFLAIEVILTTMAWAQGSDPFVDVFSWTGFTVQLGWKGKIDPTPALVQNARSSCLSPPFYCSFSPLVFARHPRCTFQHHDGNVRKWNLWFPGVRCPGEWSFCGFRVCFQPHFQSVPGDSFRWAVGVLL